jgi:hypothetical protein
MAMIMAMPAIAKRRQRTTRKAPGPANQQPFTFCGGPRQPREGATVQLDPVAEVPERMVDAADKVLKAGRPRL